MIYSETWQFQNKVKFFLHISFAFASSLVNCGSMKFTSSQTKTVPIESAILVPIEFEQFEEDIAAVILGQQ